MAYPRPSFAALAAAALAATAGCGTSSTPSAGTPPQIGRPIQAVRAPVSRRPLARAAPPPPLAESERTSRPDSLPAARRAAVRFFVTYLGFAYGRLPAARVADASAALQLELRQGASFVTPAERLARPRLSRVSVAPAGPPSSVLATATVLAGAARYPLEATLEPHRGEWIVVAVED